MIIDLRSDTVTRPTKEMLAAMFSAKVGDDVFGDDPTVRALEAKAATMFDKDGAIYCPSGTMTNQIAIKAHTQPLDHIICHRTAHIYVYEVGGHAFHSGVSAKALDGPRGQLQAEDIRQSINPDFDWFPVTKLVLVENSCNVAGGTCYSLENLQAIYQVCQENNLRLHLDGARLFNALAETKISVQTIGKMFDSISICLSKGLGAPVGSLLIGNADFIHKARRIRKVLGGSMRQAGYLAAAGIYALDHHIDRLQDDHRRAKTLGAALRDLRMVKHITPIETNMILLQLDEKCCTAPHLVSQLAEHDIKIVPNSKTEIRLVTHLDFTDAMLDKFIHVLQKIDKKS